VKKPKKKPVPPVTEQYVPPAPVYNTAPPRPILQPEPEPSVATELWAYGVVESKHAFYRQAFIDYDACVAGGGLRVIHGGFFLGEEGLTDCDDEDQNGKKKPKKKKHGHYGYDEEWGWNYGGYGHHGSKNNSDDDGFDRIAIYGGWQGNLHGPFVLDIEARHEFADDDQDVTRVTGLVGYEFYIAKESTLTPYTGAEVLLTNRDEPCIEDTVWTWPVGIRTQLVLDKDLMIFGDGSVNFSDDDRQVGVIEIGAEYNFAIAGMPFVLVPSGAWVSRFDDEKSTNTHGGYGWHEYGRHCRGAECEQDDEFFVGKLELRGKIADLF
jgi:hypothetical protein